MEWSGRTLYTYSLNKWAFSQGGRVSGNGEFLRFVSEFCWEDVMSRAIGSVTRLTWGMARRGM
jgi:hypothetical protein